MNSGQPRGFRAGLKTRMLRCTRRTKLTNWLQRALKSSWSVSGHGVQKRYIAVCIAQVEPSQLMYIHGWPKKKCRCKASNTIPSATPLSTNLGEKQTTFSRGSKLDRGGSRRCPTSKGAWHPFGHLLLSSHFLLHIG
jgi:hypothetical protein